MKYWEGKYIVMSTVHITERDNEILAQICRYKKELRSMLQILPCDYGYIIIPAQHGMREGLKADCREYGLELSVWYPIFKFCKENRYSILRLDRDGEAFHQFKVFKW